jgi:putative transposase
MRRECLDWLLIANRRQLERLLRSFLDHYNGHRPHRSLGLAAPDRGAGHALAEDALSLNRE